MITTLIIILNITILEIILSVDNAAVLATMVQDLPQKEQKKALSYGIVGAYLFRFIALLFASLLISITWLKIIGGAYLVYLCIKSFYGTEDTTGKSSKKSFWATVVSIEIMDLIFSIDNILASVSFTKSLVLITVGVFVGILAIRFATGLFIKIIKNNPIIEKIAYGVIGMLGLKLILSYFIPVLNTEVVDIIFSVLTMAAFIIPLVFKKKINGEIITEIIIDNGPYTDSAGYTAEDRQNENDLNALENSSPEY
jgi:YkoY family integral membrane protein